MKHKSRRETRTKPASRNEQQDPPMGMGTTDQIAEMVAMAQFQVQAIESRDLMRQQMTATRRELKAIRRTVRRIGVVGLMLMLMGMVTIFIPMSAMETLLK